MGFLKRDTPWCFSLKLERMKLANTIIITLLSSISFSAVESDSLKIEPINLLDVESKKEIENPFKNRRSERPIGMNLYGFGPGGLANASIDVFVTPKIALEGGGGFMNLDGDIGYFLGARYHVFGNSFLNLTPYVGAYTAFHHNGRDLQNHSLYVPFGLHKIKKSGVTWSVEVAYEKSVYETNHLSGGFRLGYRF